MHIFRYVFSIFESLTCALRAHVNISLFFKKIYHYSLRYNLYVLLTKKTLFQIIRYVVTCDINKILHYFQLSPFNYYYLRP